MFSIVEIRKKIYNNVRLKRNTYDEEGGLQCLYLEKENQA